MFPTCLKILCRGREKLGKGPREQGETSAPLAGSPSITGAKSYLLGASEGQEDPSSDSNTCIFLLKLRLGPGHTSIP